MEKDAASRGKFSFLNSNSAPVTSLKVRQPHRPIEGLNETGRQRESEREEGKLCRKIRKQNLIPSFPLGGQCVARHSGDEIIEGQSLR